MSVLFLARWYPSKYDPMPGLFIQRHAEAVALHADVSVVYPHAIQEKGDHLFEVNTGEVHGVFTVRVFYHVPESANLFTKSYRFFKAVNLGVQEVVKKKGSFQLIHVNVLTRLGFAALYYHWKFKIPYLITEHWTRYLKPFPFKNRIHKWISRWVVQKSAMVTTVSEDLTQAMKNCSLRHRDYRVIRNVVAPFFYTFPLSENRAKGKEFIHVSCFTDQQKNISGLLRVIGRLAEVRDDFHFLLVGEGEDLEMLKQYARELKIPEKVLAFKGLLEGKALAETMSNADALVLFSNYENMPVVINESLVLGVPVFSTRVGGISEIIDESNGRLVEKGDEQALVNLFIEFLNGQFSFDRKKIREDALNSFSYETVGTQLVSYYQEILNR
ncbi:MAG: glycosyltransferase [Bacteroidales bacterium]|nr:glycosyltransferase [Bacteroidales bacterium]